MQAVAKYSGEKAFSEIVASVYRAAGSPMLWRTVLEHLTLEFGSFGAQLNVYDPVKGEVMLSISHGCEWLTPARLRRYLELAHTDPRVPYALAHPGMPSHCRQAASEAVLHSSQIYKEILGPGDCEYSMVAQTPVGDKAFFIGVLRHRTQEQYTHEDVGRFSLFMPHIRRSIRLGLSLSQLDYSHQVATAAFDTLAVGVALVASDIRVLYANGAAKSLLSRLSGKTEASMISQALHPQLANLVAVAAESGATGGSAPTTAPLEIVCSTGRAIRIRVTGIDDVRARPLLGAIDRNCAMLILEESDSDIETLDERLMRMFGLTVAEIRVAKGVAEGRNPKVLARETGVSSETIRSQLKAVFRKTHTASQSALAKLLGDLPVWPSLPPPKLEEIELSTEA